MNILTVLLYPVRQEGLDPATKSMDLWRAQGLESDIQADGLGPFECKKAFLIEVERKLAHWAGRIDHIKQAPREHFEVAVSYTKQGPLLPVWRDDPLYDRIYVRFLESPFREIR